MVNFHGSTGTRKWAHTEWSYKIWSKWHRCKQYKKLCYTEYFMHNRTGIICDMSFPLWYPSKNPNECTRISSSLFFQFFDYPANEAFSRTLHRTVPQWKRTSSSVVYRIFRWLAPVITRTVMHKSVHEMGVPNMFSFLRRPSGYTVTDFIFIIQVRTVNEP